jgi:hypothetical protein
VPPGYGGCCGNNAQSHRCVIGDVSALPHGAHIGAVCTAADRRELDVHAVRPDVDRGPPENGSRIHAICGCALRTLTGAAPPHAVHAPLSPPHGPITRKAVLAILGLSEELSGRRSNADHD